MARWDPPSDLGEPSSAISAPIMPGRIWLNVLTPKLRLVVSGCSAAGDMPVSPKMRVPRCASRLRLRAAGLPARDGGQGLVQWATHSNSTRVWALAGGGGDGKGADCWHPPTPPLLVGWGAHPPRQARKPHPLRQPAVNRPPTAPTAQTGPCLPDCTARMRQATDDAVCASGTCTAGLTVCICEGRMRRHWRSNGRGRAGS